MRYCLLIALTSSIKFEQRNFIKQMCMKSTPVLDGRTAPHAPYRGYGYVPLRGGGGGGGGSLVSMFSVLHELLPYHHIEMEHMQLLKAPLLYH